MIEIRKGAAYMAIVVLVLVVMLFIGMYVTMKPFALLFTHFTNEGGVGDEFLDLASCEAAGHIWINDDSVCSTLEERPFKLLHMQRRMWLLAPFVFVVSILIWFWLDVLRPKNYAGAGGGP